MGQAGGEDVVGAGKDTVGAAAVDSEDVDQAATEILTSLADLPGAPEVLALAASRADVELVGGTVRDLLIGRAPREIDLALDGEPASFPNAAGLFARDLAAQLQGSLGEQPHVAVHERFGTATVRWSEGSVDVAARREESYPHPGSLPEVGPGTPEHDLRRRDFTVNALAVALGGPDRGTIRAPADALEDLRAGCLRVLHERSFREDPTRLMRLGRYAARLGFSVEARTAELAKEAIAAGALATVSAARIGAELRLAAREEDPVATLAELDRLGVLAALDPPLSFDPELFGRARELLPAEGSVCALAMGCLLMRVAGVYRAAPAADSKAARDRVLLALERFEHPAAEREAVLQSAVCARAIAAQLARAERPSRLWDLLDGVPCEAVALAGAIVAHDHEGQQARAAARRWLTEIRHVRLQIGGRDLIGAGVPAGPEIGARLAAVLRLRLDGEIEQGAEAELRAALEG